MTSREDVLSDFTVEEDPAAVLKAYLQRHPEHAKDLLALFNELVMSDLEAEEKRREKALSEMQQYDAERGRV